MRVHSAYDTMEAEYMYMYIHEAYCGVSSEAEVQDRRRSGEDLLQELCGQ